MIGRYAGIPVFKAPYLVKSKTVQARTHRKKRINKKWLKRYGYKSISYPDPEVYLTFGTLYGHPETLIKLEHRIKEL